MLFRLSAVRITRSHESDIMFVVVLFRLRHGNQDVRQGNDPQEHPLHGFKHYVRPRPFCPEET